MPLIAWPLRVAGDVPGAARGARLLVDADDEPVGLARSPHPAGPIDRSRYLELARHGRVELLPVGRIAALLALGGASIPTCPACRRPNWPKAPRCAWCGA
ncbi:MAG TPA: hypothetical protein VNO86_05065 [Candidatus Binatia bacterium]|nr:hypothetical protein [Candidatus Binatia bacterium]